MISERSWVGILIVEVFWSTGEWAVCVGVKMDVSFLLLLFFLFGSELCITVRADSSAGTDGCIKYLGWAIAMTALAVASTAGAIVMGILLLRQRKKRTLETSGDENQPSKKTPQLGTESKTSCDSIAAVTVQTEADKNEPSEELKPKQSLSSTQDESTRKKTAKKGKSEIMATAKSTEHTQETKKEKSEKSVDKNEEKMKTGPNAETKMKNPEDKDEEQKLLLSVELA